MFFGFNVLELVDFSLVIIQINGQLASSDLTLEPRFENDSWDQVRVQPGSNSILSLGIHANLRI